ncbi:phosphoenolpyruvate--protein phosphotransferase [Nonomuraea glycinis]|uniref:Phosphoenolpyruvate-protein phosphotransferase n=1 Tax=Nonomuraea glycinis TaxID=2047744 RepID=A0A918A3V7_9ACTN|nr:phosphoenolpyruvate--protein phosphotransferase [Nonomuraea glycinis]MCA2175938.1 phosphoenolpyruvate--protein phosphotransferase [Nonomuraea glycinis]GGP05688.1 phosphoenolpyruvate-protein phosphotransferase [Nonomuraea glycinis]
MNLRGVGVSPGIGHGPAYILTTRVPEPPEGATYTGESDQEKERAVSALAQVAGELESRGDRAGGEAGEILKAQALMAEDPGLIVKIRSCVEQGMAAERAVYESFGKYREVLAGLGGYLGERAADLDDIRDRVIAVLTGQVMPGLPTPGPEPYVLVAHDLAPADTALLSRETVAAFVTEQGGPTSHTAIIARALGVPAVVACAAATTLTAGVRVLVDGTSGEVRAQPTASDVAQAQNVASARQEAIAQVRGPGRTQDGVAVPLLANVGGPGDVEAALAAGAEGIGLYRTEFLYLGRRQPPRPEEQEEAYRAALDAFPGGPVVVRTLDAGADKPLAFLPPPAPEPNPALGERGVRLFRRHPEVMETQLDALATAAAGSSGRLHVMAAMVATAEEARWFAAACRSADLPSAGVMIEVPAAALRAPGLLAEVDFVSIGTNDLAQYCFAADRELGALSELQDRWQPALLDLVAMTVSAARAAGKPCGVCGEAAADPAMACVLVGLGATTLSMSPAVLPATRAALAGHTMEQCRFAAQAAREAPTAAQARAAARAHLPGLAPLGL